MWQKILTENSQTEGRQQFKMAITKYKFKFLFVLDSICYVMTYPWMAMLSLFCSCFWTTTEEGKNPSRKFVHYIVYAPILGLIEILTFPLAVFGYFFWILICNGTYLYFIFWEGHTNFLKNLPIFIDITKVVGSKEMDFFS